MKLLVFGGSGNISSDFVRVAQAQGHQITLCNRGSVPPPAGVEQLVVDRRDEAGLTAVLQHKTFDVAIDFLCFDPADAQLIHRLLQGKIGQYIFISTATVYAKPHQLPVRENAPLGNPALGYAQNKLACEQWFAAQLNWPLTIVRPSHTFSKTRIPSILHGSDWTVASRMLAGKEIIVHDEGQTLWALTPTEDFAVALAGLLGNKAAIGEAVHITTDEVLTWRGIYQELGYLLGVEPRLVSMPTTWLADHHPHARAILLGDKANQGKFDNSKIRTLVPGWRCSMRLREALARSIAWFQANPSRLVPDKSLNQNIDDLIQKWRTTSTS